MVPALILPLLFLTVTGAPSNICPENCKCTQSGPQEVKAACMSTDFLEKLPPKQITQITELDLSELSLKTIPGKLRKLKNLKKLDLTGNLISDLSDFPHFPKLTHLSLKSNNLQNFSAKDLPGSLKQLDLSSNHISEFRDLPKLNKLEKIDLNDNYINCDCAFLKIRDSLLKRNVNFIYPTKCFSPDNVNNVPLLHVYCVNDAVLYDDFLQNDEPKDVIEDDYVKTNVETSAASNEDEGSGSGDIPIILPSSDVAHCLFDCSTPKQIESDPSLPKNDLPKQILNEIIGTPTEPPVVKEEQPKLDSALPHEEVEKNEENSDIVGNPFIKSEKKLEEGETNQADERAVPPRDGEVVPEPKSSKTTYIVVACLLIVMAALVVYAVVKRKKKNNRRRSVQIAEKHPSVEMKPLVSKPNGNDVTPAIAEKVPLMNGQNGHTENGDATQKQNEDATDEVELRPSAEEPVTPDATKRVTIKAKEYPSPKSPVMIQRRLDDDGRVVVTPSSPENRD